MTQYLNPSVVFSIEFRKMLGKEKLILISLLPNVPSVCSSLLNWIYILLIRILFRGVITSHVYASISAYVKVYPYPRICILLIWQILMSIHWNHILWSSTKAQVFNYTGWDHSVLYITCTVQHIYFTAEMYGVVLYTDDVQLLYGTFLIYDQCNYSPENRYTNIFSLNTDEIQQWTRL